MLFQELFGTIIGSVISTVGAILVWVIIEGIKWFRIKRKVNKKFSQLYTLFSRNELEPYMSIDIADLIDDIGSDKFSKILRLTLEFEGTYADAYTFMNQQFTIEIFFMKGKNDIHIFDGNIGYNYRNERTNTVIKERFLKYLRDQCKKEKIKILISEYNGL